MKKLAVNDVSVTPIESAKINVLADPEILLVFSAIVVSTSNARLRDVVGSPICGISYITLHGLERNVSLPQDVIKKAVKRLEQAGLLEVPSFEKHQPNSWRVNEIALATALA
jgi:hypothetical protein